jgi:hypothetical protein
MLRRIGPAALALEFALALPAGAGTSVTPPVHNDVDRVGCVVQNRGKSARTVTATLRDQVGSAIQTFAIEIPPGLSAELVFTASFQPSVHCEFEGTSGKIRGYLEVQSAGGGTTQLLLPAD